MKKYLCIGGPVNGLFLDGDEMHSYKNNGKPVRNEYSDYNASGYHGKEFPSMVRLHDSLVKNTAKSPK